MRSRLASGGEYRRTVDRGRRPAGEDASGGALYPRKEAPACGGASFTFFSAGSDVAYRRPAGVGTDGLSV
jgi:hypothetical protein